MTKGKDRQVEVAAANQGGGATAGAKFRQRSAVGDSVSSHRIAGTRFRITPGFIGAGLSQAPSVPVSDLDLSVLYAKADPFGPVIPPQVWQRDHDPVFVWEPPAGAPDVAGYSYAVDDTPDEIIDTTGTSFNVATSGFGALADGKRLFSVKAINTAGTAGKPISVELWVDRTPPQIGGYAPAPGVLLNAGSPAVSATVADASSGVDPSSVKILVNGGIAPVVLVAATGTVSTTGGGWQEGTNSLELRVADLVGNAQAPLIWSVTIDTIPPSGTLTINAGATMTSSVYVTLQISASDATSRLDRILLSNEEATRYAEEPYVALRELWMLRPVRGTRRVYGKFVDGAGNVSEPVSDEIELGLLSPDTLITSGPAGFVAVRSASFGFLCPEGSCVFAYAFDNDEWSSWSSETSAPSGELAFGNHYFRVKAAKEANGIPEIQPDEEDPSPAERVWVVGVEPSVLAVPKGPPIKVWRLE